MSYPLAEPTEIGPGIDAWKPNLVTNMWSGLDRSLVLAWLDGRNWGVPFADSFSVMAATALGDGVAAEFWSRKRPSYLPLNDRPLPPPPPTFQHGYAFDLSSLASGNYGDRWTGAVLEDGSYFFVWSDPRDGNFRLIGTTLRCFGVLRPWPLIRWAP